jgi:hypothetical protein
MESKPCVCGASIPVQRSLCGACLREYGAEPDGWPNWLRAATRDIQREWDAARKRGDLAVEDWNDVPPLQPETGDLRFPPHEHYGDGQPPLVAVQMTEDRRAALSAARARSAREKRISWPDSAWSFRHELEAWELGGVSQA